MDAHQRWAFNRRLELEELEWKFRQELGGNKKGCQHVIIKGRILYSPAQGKVVWTHEGQEDDDCCFCSCAICGEDFGWWCPKSPNHICEYKYGGCIYCGEPDERK